MYKSDLLLFLSSCLLITEMAERIATVLVRSGLVLVLKEVVSHDSPVLRHIRKLASLYRTTCEQKTPYLRLGKTERLL
jgi:hypothetical protein